MLRPRVSGIASLMTKTCGEKTCCGSFQAVAEVWTHMDTLLSCQRRFTVHPYSVRISQNFGYLPYPKKFGLPIKYDREIFFDDFWVPHLKSLPECRLPAFLLQPAFLAQADRHRDCRMPAIQTAILATSNLLVASFKIHLRDMMNCSSKC